MGRSPGDEILAAAVIDRPVHHAEVRSLEGGSYRLTDRGDLGGPHPTTTEGA